MWLEIKPSFLVESFLDGRASKSPPNDIFDHDFQKQPHFSSFHNIFVWRKITSSHFVHLVPNLIFYQAWERFGTFADAGEKASIAFSLF